MNKVLKIISTILIVLGLGYVYLYIISANAMGIEMLQRPSYYARQNFLYVFFAGAAVLIFSILSSFFVWHKDAEPQEEVLLNAGFTDKKQIASWLSGSTLDLEQKAENMNVGVEYVRTEILSEKEEASTEILKEEQTLILPDDNVGETGTEILTEEE